VEDVGTGVGYDTCSSSMALNLRLLGSPGGEDEKGSKAGSNEGCRVWFGREAGVLLECEFRGLGRLGEVSMMVNCGAQSLKSCVKGTTRVGCQC